MLRHTTAHYGTLQQAAAVLSTLTVLLNLFIVLVVKINLFQLSLTFIIFEFIYLFM